MPNGVFECATENCSESIAAEGLNKIQLEVLRRWAKTCPRCQQRTKWQEKLPLLNTEQQKQVSIGGITNAKSVKKTHKNNARAKAAADTNWQH